MLLGGKEQKFAELLAIAFHCNYRNLGDIFILPEHLPASLPVSFGGGWEQCPREPPKSTPMDPSFFHTLFGVSCRVASRNSTVQKKLQVHIDRMSRRRRVVIWKWALFHNTKTSQQGVMRVKYLRVSTAHLR